MPIRFRPLPGRLAAAGLAVLLAAAPLPALPQLPSMGESGEMTVATERRMGERIARELYRDPDYIDDAVIVEYVQGLWQPLLAAARARGDLTNELDERFAWQVLLGKDRSINAFALPGGWLGLHLGLVGVTTSRDELASVLAHELSHVTQRHISRIIGQQNRNQPWVIAAMILGAMAASRNADAGNAMLAGSQALAMQNQLNFSRDMEREADRIGLGVLAQAGFEPQGFVTMFDKLQQASRLNDSGSFPYLRSHPLTTERIAEMQSRQQMAALPPARGASGSPGLLHALVAARARVLSNVAVDSQRGFLVEAQGPGLAAQPPQRQAGVLYAAVLAAARLRETAAASRLLAQLEAMTARDPAAARLVRLLGAEVALAAGDAARAQSLAELGAGGRPEVLLAAEARLRAGQGREVAERLQTWVATQPRDAAGWQMLARAWQAAGQPLRGIRAEAEAHVATLDYQAAMDRLRAAQDLVRRGGAGGDHIEASIIDARTRQVELLLREQAAER